MSIFTEIFSIPADDGLVFDLASLKAREITKLDEYLGTNISITALLGNTRLPVSIDIGFGDVIVPSKKEMSFPVLLDMENTTQARINSSLNEIRNIQSFSVFG